MKTAFLIELPNNSEKVAGELMRLLRLDGPKVACELIPYGAHRRSAFQIALPENAPQDQVDAVHWFCMGAFNAGRMWEA